MMPMIDSNGVEKVFLPETGNPALMSGFVSLFGVQLWPLEIKHGPLSSLPCKTVAVALCSEAEDWGEAAVPIKSFRDSYPMTPVLLRVTTLQQGTSERVLFSFCLNEIFTPLPKFIPPL